jgi:uncharacterized protein YggE
MFLAAFPAAGEVIETKPPLITVNGEAEVRVPPDEVVITLGVETSDMELATATDDNDERTKRVIHVVQSLGVKAEHVQTDYFEVEPKYRFTYDEREFLGYSVRKTIVVRLHDLSKFEHLLSAALEGGANHVHGIEFRTTKLREYRDRARSMAIGAAREKAAALAKELDQAIGRPHEISELPSGWRAGYGWSWWGRRRAGSASPNAWLSIGEGAGAFEGTIAPGQITITAAVTVSFELR